MDIQIDIVVFIKQVGCKKMTNTFGYVVNWVFINWIQSHHDKLVEFKDVVKSKRKIEYLIQPHKPIVSELTLQPCNILYTQLRKPICC